ncbi:MGMT family protein [bacterium]|nr:MGMT family protein [bacterium]
MVSLEGSSPGGGLYDRIYQVVRLIPRGRVAIYGQIAAYVGRCTPRQVGYAMAALPSGLDVPWHRVINREGRISFPRNSSAALEQSMLLQAEGVVFDESERVELDDVGWAGLLADSI